MHSASCPSNRPGQNRRRGSGPSRQLSACANPHGAAHPRALPPRHPRTHAPRRAHPGVTAYDSLHIYVRTATAQRECTAPPARQIGLVKTGGGGAGHPGSFPLAQTRMVQHILGRIRRAIPRARTSSRASHAAFPRIRLYLAHKKHHPAFRRKPGDSIARLARFERAAFRVGVEHSIH